jgi:tRNA dimethylallyltransferase
MYKANAFFLVGPTASGKSAIAHLLAAKRGCSVVSADSMNVYRGMDIGTAKPLMSERNQVVYHGIDVVEPTEAYHVAAWLTSIQSAWSEATSPVVCGGTGLYIKCLTEGLDSSETEDAAQRAHWETYALDTLQAEAAQLVPDGYAALTADDRQNPRRLIRLLERKGNGVQWQEGRRVKLVGLQIERTHLHQRIQDRIEQMYADGLLDEAATLLPLKLSATAQQAIGYAEAFACLTGQYTEAEAMERTVIRTRQLAKRQMTWFRNQMDVEWIEVEANASVESVAEAVETAWAHIGAGEVHR